ncbi:flavodoxin family protein [Nonomuraea candida]|uniref:flavodoxin family protein n=1 Tax=Nonomuraea candida TaxID=359159 RepID=UPI0006950E2F|nr:NAD(P)H-dependent oxidoreductase [Nonomuraea candida]
MRRFLFLLGSARQGGNAETLARRAADQLPASARQRWLHLDDHPLPPFRDIRHVGGGAYPPPEGNEKVLIEATLDATDLVIVSPLYWYSVSATTKLYLDYWSGWMRVPGYDFRKRMGGKTMWAVTTISEEDQSVVDPLVGMLRRSGEYFGGRWGGALVGYANRPGDILRDVDALERAKTFFT